MTMHFDPTPLYLLDTDANGNRWHIKREDLLPYSFGGNKVRIGLEYLKDMKARGADHLVAYGNARSNLCRVLGNLCAGEGLPMTLISPADEDGQRRPAFNADLCRLFGAGIVPCTKANVAETVDGVLADIRHKGQTPYYIYGDRLGRGNEAVPTRAYVPVWQEITAQCTSIRPDVICLAAGTGMTMAGLLCGRLLSGGGPQVVGISVARDTQSVQAHVADYANAWLKEQGRPERIPADQVDVCDAYRLSYGVYDENVAESLRTCMARYGLPVDGTYVGKALNGAMRLAAKRWQNKNILFLHTGGTPLFFDALEQARG